MSFLNSHKEVGQLVPGRPVVDVDAFKIVVAVAHLLEDIVTDQVAQPSGTFVVGGDNNPLPVDFAGGLLIAQPFGDVGKIFSVVVDVTDITGAHVGGVTGTPTGEPVQRLGCGEHHVDGIVQGAIGGGDQVDGAVNSRGGEFVCFIADGLILSALLSDKVNEVDFIGFAAVNT